MKIKHLLVIAGLTVSCNGPGKSNEKTNSPSTGTNQPSEMKCYSYAGETDTIVLNVLQTGDSVTGTLVYHFKEKDRNTGTIQGNMKGNILVAYYTFMSEGSQSVRQIAFKQEENYLIEGYGDGYLKNEKMYFKNIDSLNFNRNMKLTKTECP